MGEQLSKLRPDRDLQCYFQKPSAVAALSDTSSSGFTVSGCWRQQFDWAVVEWNRDNVFEHPVLRNLPDGDLSGIQLTYEEARVNCLPLDSTTYDAVDWSYLRIWEQHVEDGVEVEELHRVPLQAHATPTEGEYSAATAEMELQGTPTVGDLIELAWLEDHCNYQLAAGDTLESSVSMLAGFINDKIASGGVLSAEADGTRIRLTYLGAPGANGNRVGIYGGVHGAGTESWSSGWTVFQAGVSPSRWRVDLDFGNLVDLEGRPIQTTNVRKLRWTWAADLQIGNFERSEFSVGISEWKVSGSNFSYRVAGPGSRRIEDDSPEVTFVGGWTEERGNYSGGSIRYSESPGDYVECRYSAATDHALYLGTRYVDAGPGSLVEATVQVDGNAPVVVDLKRAGEDKLIRYYLGEFAPGAEHVVILRHSGTAGAKLFFDYLEIALPTVDLPAFERDPITTLATDWDTDHSLAIAPERTAWLMSQLGFRGRANHYAGAMWFYELCSPGNRYASATVTFAGEPQFLDVTQIMVGETPIRHVSLTSHTPVSIATCFELLIRAGSSAVWAHADGPTLTIVSRTMGTAGNSVRITAQNSGDSFTATASSTTLAGGCGASADRDEAWRTDVLATPRLNRAVRDWSRSYFRALAGYGIDGAAAFSMELRHGDDSPEAGIAQRYPGGAVWVNTPALQTNFSPSSRAFWDQVYRDMADVMSQAGVQPYLQFGEVQWWYKPDDGSGMPFYDDYTKDQFAAAYGRPLALIASQNVDPSLFPGECALLPSLIGRFTDGIMDFVRQSYPDVRFEVLYPTDVNDTALNRAVNFPVDHWTARALTCLKTENFTYTGDRNLDKVRESIGMPMAAGFPNEQSSHLVGIGDYATPWAKERRLSIGENVESVVLFALDQFCLVGYRLPLERSSRAARFMGR